MLRFIQKTSLLLTVLFCTPTGVVCATETLEQRIAAALELFEGAETRYQTPALEWFESTRAALQEETERVGLELESHGAGYAAAWKQHLHWPLLVRSLGEVDEVDPYELALVRRWLFSNRQGLEYPFFAQLRERTETHLDAIVTFTQATPKLSYQHRVAEIRQQLLALAENPCDETSADLGRTLGWFEQTRQLTAETTAARQLLSFPNLQLVISKSMLKRTMNMIASEVKQTLPVSDRVTSSVSSLLGRPKTINVRGTATSSGQITLEMTPNTEYADLQLVYEGEVNSHCRAVAGPVTVAMQTLGPIRAVTPLQLSLQGIKVLTTQVSPQVKTRITGVSAKSELLRRLGKRRAFEPESQREMNSRASQTTSELLQAEIDKRIATVLEEIQTELRQTQSSLKSLQEVMAPVVREGAEPRLVSIQSTNEGVVVNVINQRREQLGAPTPCPLASSADVQIRVHVSFFNNMLETIMAGKTFTDKYFMKYSKVLQAELPPQLMVHSRSGHWAIVAAKPRPLEISIPAANEIQIQLRIERVEIGDQFFTGPTVATVRYALQKNEFDEYQLYRQGEVTLESVLPEASQVFLQQKLNAFFAAEMNGGGVALPEGGTLGRLRGLLPHGVSARDGWLNVGIRVPNSVLTAWLPREGEYAEAAK